MPHRLEHLPNDKTLSLVEAAALLGLEPLTLETLALRKAYGLKKHHDKTRRMLKVSDPRAFVFARQETTS